MLGKLRKVSRDDVLEAICTTPGITDIELREKFGVINQRINTPARWLENEGFIIRTKEPINRDGFKGKKLIANYPNN